MTNCAALTLFYLLDHESRAREMEKMGSDPFFAKMGSDPIFQMQ